MGQTKADPLGIAAGQSLYGYVDQDPPNWVDPDGLQARPPARRPGMGHNGGPSFYNPGSGGPINRGRGEALGNWLGNHAPGVNPYLPEAGGNSPMFSQDHNDHMQRLANHAYNEATRGGKMCVPYPPPPGYNLPPAMLGGPVFVDPAGNAFPAPPGGSLGSSPNGMWREVKDSNGDPVVPAIRMDGEHPASHAGNAGARPHGHQDGITNPDGTPWLPVRE